MDSKLTSGKRLLRIRKLKNLLQKDIAEAMKVSKQAVTRMEKDQSGVTEGNAYLLKAAYPDINLDYLLKGEGEPILNDRKLKDQNNGLRILEESASSYIGVVKEGERKYVTKKIPVFDEMEMTASNIDVYQDHPESATTFFEIDILSDSDFFIPVAGDSMRPEYKPGDRVGLRRIRDGIINYGHDYLIVTESNRLFKTIKKSERSDEYVKLCSYNNEYECFEIERSKIIALFIATGDVSRKSQ